MIALLGTGTMGLPMARNLRAAGFDLRAYNRTIETARPLEADGVEVCASAADAAAGAEVVITMLSDGDAVTGVLEDGGALAAMDEGAVLIQMSTVGIAATDAIAALCEAHRVQLVDAPVLGTKSPAEKGELDVLASGPDGLREQCEPVFDAVGKRTTWLGAAGGGTRMKLVLNNWLTTLTAGVAESVALAKSMDLDPSTFLDIIRGGPLGVPYADLKGGAMVDDSYPFSFALSLAAKDTGLVLDAAARHNLQLTVTEAVAGRFRAAEAAGHGADDMAAIAREI